MLPHPNVSRSNGSPNRASRVLPVLGAVLLIGLSVHYLSFRSHSEGIKAGETFRAPAELTTVNSVVEDENEPDLKIDADAQDVLDAEERDATARLHNQEQSVVEDEGNRENALDGEANRRMEEGTGTDDNVDNVESEEVERNLGLDKEYEKESVAGDERESTEEEERNVEIADSKLDSEDRSMENEVQDREREKVENAGAAGREVKDSKGAGYSEESNVERKEKEAAGAKKGATGDLATDIEDPPISLRPENHEEESSTGSDATIVDAAPVGRSDSVKWNSRKDETTTEEETGPAQMETVDHEGARDADIGPQQGGRKIVARDSDENTGEKLDRKSKNALIGDSKEEVDVEDIEDDGAKLDGFEREVVADDVDVEGRNVEEAEMAEGKNGESREDIDDEFVDDNKDA